MRKFKVKVIKAKKDKKGKKARKNENKKICEKQSRGIGKAELKSIDPNVQSETTNQKLESKAKSQNSKSNSEPRTTHSNLEPKASCINLQSKTSKRKEPIVKLPKSKPKIRHQLIEPKSQKPKTTRTKVETIVKIPKLKPKITHTNLELEVCHPDLKPLRRPCRQWIFQKNMFTTTYKYFFWPNRFITSEEADLEEEMLHEKEIEEDAIN